MRYFFFSVLSVIFLLVSMQAYANEEILIVPQCLFENDFKYDELAKLQNLHLIKTTQLSVLESSSLKDSAHCRGFLNTTIPWKKYVKNHGKNATVFLRKYLLKATPGDFTHGYKIQYQAHVEDLIAKINLTQVKDDLTTLTNFPDRSANSESGIAAAKWIKQQIDTMIKASGNNDVEVYTLSTEDNIKQSSIILKIGKHLKEPAIVIGTHLDTIKHLYENRPGADDNASGVATQLETARILLNSHYSFAKPIYLIWYAGSEEGKLGVQTVVDNFNKHHIAVDSVMQLDRTGYLDSDNAGIGLMDDFTDTGLNAFVADLIANYVKLPAGSVRCGYACSDNIIWYQNGNRVAYPFETMSDNGSPYVNTRDDKISKLSMDHIGDFIKLSLGFAVELAGIEGGPRDNGDL